MSGKSIMSLNSESSLLSARQAEQQRMDDVKSSFQVLHRWTDASLGLGFDVLVFPKCVIVLDPNDPASSKTIVFSKDTKVFPFYKMKAECCEDIFCGSKSQRETVSSTSSSGSVAQPKKYISELRICVRDSSASRGNDTLFLSSSDDIVLRWVAPEDK
jgi:hypothetical protein